jgi:hypothetical protein
VTQIKEQILRNQIEIIARMPSSISLTCPTCGT